MFTVNLGSIWCPHHEQSLSEAKAWAEQNLLYTAKDVVVFNDKTEVARLKWHFGRPTNKNQIRVCDGYYCWEEKII